MSAAPPDPPRTAIPRLPVGGRIRAGIKILTKSAAQNPAAVEIYNRGVAKGVSYDAIEKKIREELSIKTPLVPKNTPYFKVHRKDFADPAIAVKILDTYAEDRGEGPELYRFPVVFPLVDWQLILPHALRCFTSAQLKYWSEYSAEGTRSCRTYEEPEIGPDHKAKRLYGGRRVIPRPDNQGICDPLECPEYQARQCNLSGSILFYVPAIPGTSLIELPTTSFYSLQQVRQQLDIVKAVRGKIWGTHHGAPLFYLTKQLREVSMLDEQGKPKRVKQHIVVLESDIDMTTILDQARPDRLLAAGREAAQRLEGQPAGPEYDEPPYADGDGYD